MADFPDLVAQWDDIANESLRPSEVPAGSGRKVFWKCDKGPDHEWAAQVRSRTIRGANCGFCAHRNIAPSMTLPATHPEIAALWHAKNTKHPEQVTHGSHDNVWWQCPTYKSHVFLARVDARCLAIYPCSICAEVAGKGGRHGATKAASAA